MAIIAGVVVISDRISHDKTPHNRADFEQQSIRRFSSEIGLVVVHVWEEECEGFVVRGIRERLKSSLN